MIKEFVPYAEALELKKLGSPFLDYEDSTEENNNYISNLKLDI